VKGIIIALIIVVIVGAFAWFFYASNQTKTEEPAATTQAGSESSKDSSENQNEIDLTGKNEISKGSTVTYSDSGFSPQSTTVKSGESITWVNDSSSTVQVGSANHPTHTINQQLTGDEFVDEFVIELAPGESETVQLTKAGNWGYHDHLKASMTGSITVE